MAQLELVQPSAQEEAFPALKPPALANSAVFGAVQLSVSHSLGDLEAVWRKMEASADLTPFQSFDWVSTWQTHIGEAAGVVPAIIVGGPPAQPLFIVPLAIHRRGPFRELAFLGSDLNDYNAPILAAGFSRIAADSFPALWRRIIRLLQDAPKTRHHLTRLTKMPARVGGQLNPLMTLGTALHPSGAYSTVLRDEWSAYYKARRNGKAQRQDRLKRKHLAAEGALRLVTATAAADIDAIVKRLIAQKERSLAAMGAANLFAPPGRRAFYEALARIPPATLRPHVSALQVGDMLAATNLGLRFRGTYYYVLASYDDGPLARFGPGTIQLQELLAYATDARDRVFDFTIGDERYKREWCEIETALYDHVSAGTIAGHFAVAGASLIRAGKRAIKQSDWLWPLAQKLRARLGNLRR